MIPIPILPATQLLNSVSGRRLTPLAPKEGLSCVGSGIAKILSWLLVIKTPQWEEKIPLAVVKSAVCEDFVV
jgi:hypothetical protein